MSEPFLVAGVGQGGRSVLFDRARHDEERRLIKRRCGRRASV